MLTLISVNALVFYGLTLLGILLHATKKWIYREISYSVFDYLFRVDLRDTLATVFTALGGTIGMLAGGAITDYHSLPSVIAVVSTAFAIDSTVLPATKGAAVISKT